MHLSYCSLLFSALLCLIGGAQEIPNSSSPDGKFELFVQPKGDGDYFAYHVETLDKKIVSGDFRSDFGGQVAIHRCPDTGVIWRADGNYFVLHEDTTRHADGFYIVAKTDSGFKALPFKRGEVIKSANIDLGFVYVSFQAWLPDNRIELIIREWDGKAETDQPIDFILDLKNDLKVLSWKVLQPEKRY